MAQFRYDETTGQEFIFSEEVGDFVPFTDAEGALDATLIFAGGALNQIGRGVKDFLGVEDRAVLQQRQREQDSSLAGLREARPVSAFIGDALPGLATLPIGGTALLAGRLSAGAAATLSMGLGALEGGLRIDPNSVNQVNSILAGTIGGLLGEGVGRGAGRVANAIGGMGSRLRRNPSADWLAMNGLEALPSERLNVQGQNIVPLQRMEQGAKTGPFTPEVFTRIEAQRAGLMNTRAARAIGLDDVDVADGLPPELLATAQDRMSEGFTGIAAAANRDGAGNAHVFGLSDDLANRIRGTRGQIPELMDRGMFKGLAKSNQLQGSEIMVARRALAQDAADAAGKGKHELADSIWRDVDELDALFQSTIKDPNMLTQYANLREQYRNLQILQGPGVINDAGNVLPKALNRRLGQKAGYGAHYKQGRPGVAGDTGDLVNGGFTEGTIGMMDAARNLAHPSLQPFRSSGTAENLALRDLGRSVASFGTDPIGASIGLGLQIAPAAGLALTGGSNRAANIAGGLLMPGGNLAGRAGGELGPTMVDLLLQEQIQEQGL